MLTMYVRIITLLSVGIGCLGLAIPTLFSTKSDVGVLAGFLLIVVVVPCLGILINGLIKDVKRYVKRKEKSDDVEETDQS